MLALSFVSDVEMSSSNPHVIFYMLRNCLYATLDTRIQVYGAKRYLILQGRKKTAERTSERSYSVSFEICFVSQISQTLIPLNVLNI